MYILCPEGWCVNLDDVSTISIVDYKTKANNAFDGVGFNLLMKGTERKESFNYPYSKYTDSREDLFEKVKNIRTEIMRLCNHNNHPKEILGNINLVKTDGK